MNITIQPFERDTVDLDLPVRGSVLHFRHLTEAARHPAPRHGRQRVSAAPPTLTARTSGESLASEPPPLGYPRPHHHRRRIGGLASSLPTDNDASAFSGPLMSLLARLLSADHCSSYGTERTLSTETRFAHLAHRLHARVVAYHHLQ